MNAAVICPAAGKGFECLMSGSHSEFFTTSVLRYRLLQITEKFWGLSKNFNKQPREDWGGNKQRARVFGLKHLASDYLAAQ